MMVRKINLCSFKLYKNLHMFEKLVKSEQQPLIHGEVVLQNGKLVHVLSCLYMYRERNSMKVYLRFVLYPFYRKNRFILSVRRHEIILAQNLY